jgi:hypothetical protein
MSIPTKVLHTIQHSTATSLILDAHLLSWLVSNTEKETLLVLNEWV